MQVDFLGIQEATYFLAREKFYLPLSSIILYVK